MSLFIWACVSCLAELASLLIWHRIQSTRGSCSKVRALHKSPQSLLTASLTRILLPASSCLRMNLCCCSVYKSLGGKEDILVPPWCTCTGTQGGDTTKASGEAVWRYALWGGCWTEASQLSHCSWTTLHEDSSYFPRPCSSKAPSAVLAASWKQLHCKIAWAPDVLVTIHVTLRRGSE